jgi:hypothetical protein
MVVRVGLGVQTHGAWWDERGTVRLPVSRFCVDSFVQAGRLLDRGYGGLVS